MNMTGSMEGDPLDDDYWDIFPPVGISWNYPDALTQKFYNNSELLATFDPLNDTSPYNNITYLSYSGDVAHTALYEGVYTAGEAFRYAWAKRHNNVGNKTAALNRLRILVKGYKLISEVAWKDSGRSYGAWVRYALPDTPKAREFFPASFYTTADHYNVTYKGFDWSCSRHISRDVTIGCLFGLTMIYALVDDDDLRETTGDIIDRTVQWFYDCNWRIIDVDGVQHTSGDFEGSRPLSSGDIILTFLQMGKLVNPEKWGSIYEHYVYDRGMIHTIGRSLRSGIDLSSKIFSGYYGCNFLYNDAPTLIFLETDPVLREIYIKNWLNVLHDFTKFHRNANFDVVWLLCHTEIEITDDFYDKPKIKLQDYDIDVWRNAEHFEEPTDKNYIIEFCTRDIKDCLMRYAVKRYPNRNFHYSTTPGTFPNRHQQPIFDKLEYYPKYDYWEPEPSVMDFVNSLIAIVEGESGDDDAGILNNALPVDLRACEDIMWQRNSFTVETTQQIPANPGLFQAPAGPEYLSVYWMAKYLELF